MLFPSDFPHLTEDTYGDEVPPHGTFLRVMLHTPHEGTIRTSIGICFETPSSGVYLTPCGFLYCLFRIAAQFWIMCVFGIHFFALLQVD